MPPRRVQIQQPLRRMRVRPIPRIDHRHPRQVPRQQMRRPRVRMPNHHRIHPHRLQRQPRIQQRLPLRHAAGAARHINDIRTQDFPRLLKRNPRPRAGLIKQRYDDPPPQRRRLLNIPRQHIPHRIRIIQRRPNLLGAEIIQIQNMPPPAQAAARIRRHRRRARRIPIPRSRRAP